MSPPEGLRPLEQRARAREVVRFVHGDYFLGVRRAPLPRAVKHAVDVTVLGLVGIDCGADLMGQSEQLAWSRLRGPLLMPSS